MPKKLAKIASYYAIFDPAIEGGFNVSFLDFPGCVTFGKNLREAKKMAAEVLGLWIEELASQKQKMPTKKSKPIIDQVTVHLDAVQMQR